MPNAIRTQINIPEELYNRLNDDVTEAKKAGDRTASMKKTIVQALEEYYKRIDKKKAPK